MIALFKAGRIAGADPVFPRHSRVLTFDGRGNGRSDRPQGAEAYSIDPYARAALAVMDGTDTERATVIGYSRGGQRAVTLAASLRNGSRDSCS